MSVVAGAWMIWRRGLTGDTGTYLGIFALVGAVLWFVLPAVAKPQ